jgi:hypothetical protein
MESADRKATQTLETFLVEHYRPGLTTDALQHAAQLIRAAASALEHEGRPLHHLRTTIVPSDEAFLSIFEAGSEAVVREAYTRAGVAFERISRAVSDRDTSSTSNVTDDGATERAPKGRRDP